MCGSPRWYGDVCTWHPKEKVSSIQTTIVNVYKCKPHVTCIIHSGDLHLHAKGKLHFHHTYNIKTSLDKMLQQNKLTDEKENKKVEVFELQYKTKTIQFKVK